MHQSNHRSSQELRKELASAAKLVKVGGRYAHFKHPDRDYQVIDLVIIEATEEVGVVYRACYGDQLTFVRPLKSWLEPVDRFVLIST